MQSYGANGSATARTCAECVQKDGGFECCQSATSVRRMTTISNSSRPSCHQLTTYGPAQAWWRLDHVHAVLTRFVERPRLKRLRNDDVRRGDAATFDVQRFRADDTHEWFSRAKLVVRQPSANATDNCLSLSGPTKTIFQHLHGRECCEGHLSRSAEANRRGQLFNVRHANDL